MTSVPRSPSVQLASVLGDNSGFPDPTPMSVSSPLRMTPAERRASGWLAGLFALRMLGLFLILPVFSLHARSLAGGEQLGLVGLAIGIYGLTQAVLQIPLGWASDRYGRKPVIVAGLLVFALGSFVAALADSLLVVTIGRALQGAGAISAAITALIADSTRDEVRTKAMAMVGGSISLSFALSLTLAPWLYTLIGMGGLFAMTGGLALAGCFVVMRLVPDVPSVPRSGPDATWRQVLLHAELARLSGGVFLLHAVQMAMFVVVPIALVEHAGLPVQHHGWVYVGVVLASLVVLLVFSMRGGGSKNMATCEMPAARCSLWLRVAIDERRVLDVGRAAHAPASQERGALRSSARNFDEH